MRVVVQYAAKHKKRGWKGEEIERLVIREQQAHPEWEHLELGRVVIEQLTGGPAIKIFLHACGT